MKIINKEKYKFPTVSFSSRAYNKILDLINATDLEVAWHGVITEVEPNEYVVTEILVYPQLVDSMNVESDDAKYAQWFMDLPDKVFNKIRLQGHSHVNMHASPSANDNKNVVDFMTQIHDYYIFMIINKDEQMHITIVDKEQNVTFQNHEIEVTLPRKMNTWADKEIKKYVNKKPQQVKVRRSLAEVNQFSDNFYSNKLKEEKE